MKHHEKAKEVRIFMTHALLRVISSFTGQRSLKLWQMESGNCLKKETWRHEREDGVWEGIIKRGAEMKESRKGSRESREY